MLLASLHNVTKLHGTRVLLDGVSFQVSSGQKIGLIGPNGCGKTTILRILLGLEEASGGSGVIAHGATVGYVPQNVEYDQADTVISYVLTEHARLTDTLRQKEHQLADADGDQIDKAMRAYQHARDAYDHIDGDHFAQRATAMLDALGLPGRSDQKVAALSGGERNVMSLAKALLNEPDLLILDEPGNHLDYLGLAWLEDFLNRFKGAVLIVSHNRYLLDRVANGIIHLSDGHVRYYDGGYSAARATRLRELLAQQSDYVANQKRLDRLEALVAKFAVLASGKSGPAWGKRLRARRTQLKREKKQAVEKPVLTEGTFQADFNATASRATVALQVRGYSKAFGDLKLFDNVELDIACGERVALIGPNGCGKTTLLRDIIELNAWDNPMIRIGPSLRVAYCSQGQEVLRDHETIIEEVVRIGPVAHKDAIGVLARFRFGWDDHDKRVADLSGGERNRLQLACAVAAKPDFLILDEPTNHLDIPAREAVEEALAEYKGTILVVSHDRYFLDKIATRVIEVRDRKLFSYGGSFAEFWVAHERTVGHVAGRVAKRDRQRKGARRGKASADLERRIAEVEQQKLDLERRMTEALSSRNPREGRRAGKQLQQVTSQLDNLYKKWLAESE